MKPKQVFRRAVNVSSTLFQITVYELPATEASHDEAPALRFIAYDPKTQAQVKQYNQVSCLRVVEAST